ncbi:chemotaxis protein [Gammaproteobacteria bacterium ESL0073]|nr:chemotaxis protein [Gammaproteobacteria bacterium ESL0073]
MSKEKTAGLSSRQKKSNFLQVLLVILLVVLIAALIVNLFYLGKKTSDDRGYVKNANDLRVYSQIIAVESLKALNGEQQSFASLTAGRAKFDTELNSLINYLDESQSKTLETTWIKLKSNINDLLMRKNALIDMHTAVETALKLVSNLRNANQNTLLKLKEEQSDIRLINQLQQESILLETIQYDLNELLTNFASTKNLSNSLNAKMKELNSIFDMLKQSGVLPASAQRVLLAATESQNQLAANIKIIADNASDVTALQGLDKSISSNTRILLDLSSDLALNLERQTSALGTSSILNYIIVILIILVVISIALLAEKTTRKRLQETAKENSVNQEAILQLLDEIGDLADGDLTVSATVSEAFTGAIADSINYSVEQLRDLVQTINKASGQVSVTAESSQALAMNLAEAAEHQAGEIAGVSVAISEMANSIDKVSETALESETVAKRSVEIAHNGNKIVHNTISGMDTIREQIQDTSKRIKRLGESSQEIGDIVGLIDDIAEQTNILALNAAIQASMAGDAGRGFAVVADEVQRLAERSSAATKQIETLVKAIQNDTNEAVISMEQTTSEVVRGAKLAENAGIALEEIETVSQALARLIQSISSAARQQASTAAHISKTMDVIQEITSQTSSGSTETAMTVGKLTTMARDMQQSVEGFKLPNN